MPGVIVAGFHRSGTSLAASVLHRAGVFMGQELVGANEFNPTGHFEDRQVIRFHDRLLAEEGHTWQVDEDFVPTVNEDRLARARKLLASRRDSHRLWGFKDPRVCFFLPMWHAAAPDAKVLVVYRDPLECTQSLEARHAALALRDSGPSAQDLAFRDRPDHALKMWLAHNRALTAFARDHPDEVLVVSHPAVVSMGSSLPHLMASVLDLAFCVDRRSPDDLVDRSLIHPRGGRQPVVDPGLVDEVMATWDQLESMAGTYGTDSRRRGRTLMREDFETQYDVHTVRMERDFLDNQVSYLLARHDKGESHALSDTIDHLRSLLDREQSRSARLKQDLDDMRARLLNERRRRQRLEGRRSVRAALALSKPAGPLVRWLHWLRRERGEHGEHGAPREPREPRKSPTSGLASDAAGPDAPTLQVVVLSKSGVLRPTAHVRVMRRLCEAESTKRMNWTVRPVDETRWSVDRERRDTVLVQRDALPSDDITRYLQELEREGIPLIVDLDDSLVDASGQLPKRLQAYVPHMRRLVEAADVTTVSTQTLQERVASIARRVELVPNHLDESLWFDSEPGPKRREGELFKIFYMGTTSHAGDLAILRPVLERLAELGQPVEFSVLGGEPVGPGQDWYRRITIGPDDRVYPRFVRWLRGAAPRFDAAVCPLADTEFNSYKSDLKYLEYSALGLPGVYSDTGPYRATVQDGKTGLLVPNSTDAWVDALLSLINDEKFANGLAEGAYRQVRSERTLDSNPRQIADLVEEMSTH